MSDLPSRDSRDAHAAALILDAYVSGRLVDREAIDYEALARYEHKRYRLATNAFYDEEVVPWDDLGAGSRSGLIAGVRHRVDAALGEV